MVLGFILLLLQQPAQGAGGRIDVTPARPEVRVGQSLQLKAAVFDAAGKPVPAAKVIWFGARFNGTVDSTGLVRGGFRGHLDIVAMATIPGNQRVTTTTRVAVIAGPPV